MDAEWWAILVTAAGVIAALLLGFRSHKAASQANTLAQEANTHAQQANDLANRLVDLEPKRSVLWRLFGSYYVLSEGMKESRKKALGDTFYSALNEARIVYGADQDAVDAINTFGRNLGNESKNIIPMFRAMARAADIEDIPFTDEALKRPFSPP